MRTARPPHGNKFRGEDSPTPQRLVDEHIDIINLTRIDKNVAGSEPINLHYYNAGI